MAAPSLWDFFLTSMNTAGKNGVTDYSGSCDYELRNKGYKLGTFYQLLSGEGKSQYLYIRAVCGALDRFCAEQGERDKPPCSSSPTRKLDTGRIILFRQESSLWSLLLASSLAYAAMLH